MKAFVFSHPGNNQDRHINEDAVLGASIFCGQAMEKPLSETWPEGPVLAAVADGMGGGPGGLEAAEAVLTCLKVLTGRKLGQESEAELMGAFNRSCGLLKEKADQAPELRGLGATVAGLWLDEGQVLVFNCGDCRVYRVRDGYLDQVTCDHSTVYQLYMEGQISKEEIRTHPLKHLVTSSVSDGKDWPEVYRKQLKLRPGDAFLICCDGVWEALSLDEMEECLKDKTLEAGAESLTEALRKADCQDNISFLLLQTNGEIMINE